MFQKNNKNLNIDLNTKKYSLERIIKTPKKCILENNINQILNQLNQSKKNYNNFIYLEFNLTPYLLSKNKNFSKNKFLDLTFKNKSENTIYINNLFTEISDQLNQKSLNYNHFLTFWQNFGSDLGANLKVIKITFLL